MRRRPDLSEDKADVAEIGVGDVLQLGKRAGGPDADHGAAGVEACDRALRWRPAVAARSSVT